MAQPRRSLDPRARATHGSFGRWRFLLALLAFGALALYTGLNLGSFFEVREVELPDLVGLDLEEARRVLRTLGLEPLTFAETIVGAAPNEITSQVPRAGTVVREGRSVSLGVNGTTEGVEVPSVVGLAETEASERLQDTSLALGAVSYVFADAPEGQVTEQQPANGALLQPGDGVDLVVSRGPEVALLRVPNLRGSNVQAAQNRLREAGFSNILTLASSVSFDRPFLVTDQTPQGGEELPASAQVTLFYSLSTDTVVQVPALAGRSLAEAQRLLRSVGLPLGGISYIDDPAQGAGVVSAEPQGYTLRDTPVALVVNRSGARETTAANPLEPFGAAPEGAQTFDAEPFGVGVGQPALGSPDNPIGNANSSGSNTAASGTAALGAPEAASGVGVVPGAPAEQARAIPFDFNPANLGMTSLAQSAYKLTLVVTDAMGERTVLEQTIAAGETLNTTVTVYGEALLQTYLNDLFFQAWNP